MIALADADATAALGARLARLLQPGDALCLWGPLGAGKSTLARGLIRALTTPEEEAPSPTFTLVQTYETADFVLAHFDLYRLDDPDEAYEIGLDEALADGVAIIEWPERLDGALPHDRLDIVLEDAGEARTARLIPHGSFQGRSVEF